MLHVLAITITICDGAFFLSSIIIATEKSQVWRLIIEDHLQKEK